MGRVSRRMQVALLCGGAFAALLLLVGQLWLMRRLSWTHTEDPAASLIGINFSCDQAEYLLLEDPALGEAGYVSDDRPGRAEWCAEALGTLLERTGAKYVRLSVQWDEVEPEEGKFDFSLLDALLVAAGEHGATANLSVGMKGQRHPEYYIPDWAFEGTTLQRSEIISYDPVLRARALSMVTAVVVHFAASPVVDSWGAENEPYIESERNNRYSLGRDYVAEVVDTIHANDPQGRPVMINHGQHFVMDRRWKDALADSDVLGQSLYPRRNEHLFGMPIVVNVLEIGPLMPNYAYQARLAHEQGKQFWVAELQGEPWTDTDSRLISPEHPSANLSPKTFAENIVYARKTGADRIYLWGAEWWLYESRFFGDERWLVTAQAAITAGQAAPGAR